MLKVSLKLYSAVFSNLIVSTLVYDTYLYFVGVCVSVAHEGTLWPLSLLTDEL